MRASKLHGLQNDFLVVLDEANPGAPAPGPDEARAWCARHTGVGADGLLLGSTATPGSGADVRMRLLNADGGPAEMSGNGIRCFAQAVARQRGIATGRLVIETDAGIRAVELAPDPGDPHVVHVGVAMGRAESGPEVPATVADALGRQGRRYGTADLGNPHLVVEVPDPWAIDLAVEGPAIEAAFAAGINVEFIAVSGSDRLDLTVWERGAGITRACGTGACAAATVARSWGLVGTDVAVLMPGGEARVATAADGTILLTGPSAWIADLVLAPASAPRLAEVTA